MGDKNNTQIVIINEEKELPAGGIFLNEKVFEEIKEIVGQENVSI